MFDNRSSSLFAIILISALFCCGKLKAEQITISNNKVRQVLSTDNDRIRITSYSLTDNAAQRELINPKSSLPYFEIGLNDKVVTSDMPLWVFEGIRQNTLTNGGNIQSLTFSGKGIVKGLKIVLQREYFDDSPLIRERMLISSNGAKHRFTNISGKNHFVFPQYSLRSGTSLNISEVRMGSYGMEVIPNYNPDLTYDNRSSRNLASCHMFHTDIIEHKISDNSQAKLKGPFSIVDMGSGLQLITSYEHASQDKTYLKNESSQITNESVIDASQGVKGKSHTVSDDDLWFIGTYISGSKGLCNISQNIRRGGYLNGEAVPSTGAWESVWSTISVTPVGQDPYQLIKHYLLSQITDNKSARESKFYYNTWGMQRDATRENLDMRDMFNEKRILEEIDYASQLNVDLFVFDDGWEQAMGIWKPHTRKLPNGLKPLLDRLNQYGMSAGVWLSLMGIDSTTQRYKEHLDWVMRDMDGKPFAAQWDHPAFDIVGDFYDLILEDHKWLVDHGIKFFKWDAINTFNSTQPNMHHGSDKYTPKEILDRYNYLAPFYVVRLMRELREYDPQVLVEIDVTEPERALIGLMPLQEGKFFWMNNGASGYGDYTTFRTKSMRNIINQTNKVLPVEIFTYATYPHNGAPYYAQRYNLNTSIVAGRGLWGNLSLMGQGDRKKVGNHLSKAKRVISLLDGHDMSVSGLIGSTPEMYQQIDRDNAYGYVIGFSGAPYCHTHKVELNTSSLLAVVNHAYRTDKDSLILDMQFAAPEDTREAFILGNDAQGVSILSATGWLNNVTLKGDELRIYAGAQSDVEIALPARAKNIKANAHFTISDSGNLLVSIPAAGAVKISWENHLRLKPKK